MPIAAAVPAIIGGVGSIAGAAIGAGASHNAANQQRQGAIDAGNTVWNVTQGSNPYLVNAANSVSDEVNGVAGNGADAANAAAAAGQAGMSSAVSSANGGLDPYAQAGQQGLNTLGSLMGQQFQFNQDDPGYQWRVQQGQQALERSGAARGISQSGATLKALTRYGQGAGSQEYQNAFNRFQQNRQVAGGLASGLAGMGLQASDQMGRNSLLGAQSNANLGMNAAQYGGSLRANAAQYGGSLRYGATGQAVQNSINAGVYSGNALMGAANAQAAGTMGAGNAWQQGFGGAVNSLGQYLMQHPIGGGRRYPMDERPDGIFAGGTYLGE